MRPRVVVITSLLLGAAQSAQAQQTDFSGKWSLSGQIIAGRNFMSFAQICDFKQTGDQLAGPCRGPEGGCSAIGVISGANVDMTCRTSFTNAPNLVGISTFHGALGTDEIVRGSCSHSPFFGSQRGICDDAGLTTFGCPIRDGPYGYQKRRRAAFAGGANNARRWGKPGDSRVFEIREANLFQVAGDFAESGAEAGA
jgi:hypothetical protein